MSETIKLAEELIKYHTYNHNEIHNAIGFIQGWLEACDIDVKVFNHKSLPVLVAEIGEGDASVIFHAHIDVVPGKHEQFIPVISDNRLYGRGAYDMKSALAAMMYAFAELREIPRTNKLLLIVVPDEELSNEKEKASKFIVEKGFKGKFVICGEPTNLNIGTEAKGVLALKVIVYGQAAHSSTPWLGENAILKAIEFFNKIKELDFTKESTLNFKEPSINLGKITGGDVINKVADRCLLEIDIRYLPTQSPNNILDQIKSIKSDFKIDVIYEQPAAIIEKDNYFIKELQKIIKSRFFDSGKLIGRDGASDVTYFIDGGIPGIEFGPIGEGHHGDKEYVEIDSLKVYKQILVDFGKLLC
ncbi:MAG: M20/M25/M40 family metallo-hydrolase [Actinobacteria bacterium]|nr:M20/M25/M40 family metallo-hydrolase [Actinomycetota bacterium]